MRGRPCRTFGTSPPTAAALPGLHCDYEWWADPVVEIPEGGTEELVRMTDGYEH